MNRSVSPPVAVPQEAPRFDLAPNAHRIGSDEEALAIARACPRIRREAAERDRDRRLPAKELDWFSGSGWMASISAVMRRTSL
jgi:hypothetical protein